MSRAKGCCQSPPQTLAPQIGLPCSSKTTPVTAPFFLGNGDAFEDAVELAEADCAGVAMGIFETEARGVAVDVATCRVKRPAESASAKTRTTETTARPVANIIFAQCHARSVS